MISRTLAEIAALCGAEVDGDATRTVDGPAALSDAGPRQISFLANPRYAEQFAATRAGAVVVTLDQPRARPDVTLLRCGDPSRAFTAVIRAFAPPEPEARAGIHPSAVVDRTAHVDASASVGPLCSIAAGARIGAHCVLRSSVVVGEGVTVGAHTVLHPHVVLYPRVELGERCIVHAGAVLGSDGFGFEPTREGWSKIPQCGTVVVGDDVEIGANTAIDRGRFGATRIGRSVKIDNLVHIAHNVVVGEAALLVAQVGIAGSAQIGKRAILAGQVGVNGHITIGAGARIGGQAGATRNVEPGAELFGTPAVPLKESLRQFTLIQRLPETHARLRELERRLALLESGRASHNENEEDA